MANEFIIKNGFHSKGDSQVTGSFGITGFSDVSASLVEAMQNNSFPFEGTANITGSLIISGSILNPGTITINNSDSPYTIPEDQQFILISPLAGDVIVNLPNASLNQGREIKFKLSQPIGGSTVTLQCQGSDNIDGSSSYTDLDIQYESISTVSDGSTGWFIF